MVAEVSVGIHWPKGRFMNRRSAPDRNARIGRSRLTEVAGPPCTRPQRAGTKQGPEGRGTVPRPASLTCTCSECPRSDSNRRPPGYKSDQTDHDEPACTRTCRSMRVRVRRRTPPNCNECAQNVPLEGIAHSTDMDAASVPDVWIHQSPEKAIRAQRGRTPSLALSPMSALDLTDRILFVVKRPRKRAKRSGGASAANCLA